MLLKILKLECCNYLGINVFLHSRHQKHIHRHSGMDLAAYVLVGVVLSLLLAGQVCGLTAAGAGEAVPTLLLAAGSLMVFLVFLPTMGHRLYAHQGLAMLRTMPVSSRTVALARLLSQYLRGLLAMLVLLLPGAVCYGVLSRQNFGYYPVMVLAIAGLPLLPLAGAALLGTGVLLLSARSRHPVGVQTALLIVLLAAVPGGMMLGNLELLQNPDAAQMIQKLSDLVTYPPARWMGKAAGGDYGEAVKFLLLSVAAFAAAAGMICSYFDRICDSVSSHRYTQANLGRIRRSSLLKALYVREIKRYVASSVYVSNTAVSPILAMAATAALFFVDLTPVEQILPVPVQTLLPLLWAAICCLMPACSVAVTMEGKQIWQIQSLPIPAKQWLDSKLLWSLTVMLPSYLFFQVAVTVRYRPDLGAFLWQMGMPLVLMAFSCVFGLWSDLRLHRFAFVREEAAVKQSLSAMVGGFGGPVISLISAGILILLDGGKLAQCLIAVTVTVCAAALYGQNCHTKLEKL